MKNKMPFVLIILLLLAVNSNASFLVKKTYFVKHNTKTDSSKTDSTKTEKSKKKKSVKSYKKLLKGAKTIDGMFKIHQKEGKIYIEIPNKIMDKTYLISSRVTAVSNNFNTTSGRMVKKPVMISFSHDKKNVYIHKPSYQRRTAPNSELITSLKRNSINPIWYVYEIKAFGKDSLSCVVDMTDIFYTKIPDLNPFEAKRTIMGAMTPKGSADKKSSKILSCKAFNKNINVKTRLCYTIKQKPYTVEVSRNIIMLKDKPMQMRHADKRIGFF